MEEDLKEILRRLEALEQRVSGEAMDEREGEERIRRYLEGLKDRILEGISKGAGAVAEPASEALSRAKVMVGESPLAVAALAFGAGLLLGALVRHRQD
ncbi:hypothetical protein TheveDRAFT_1410 [Thermanaerovibrio velox DSM 12556]|uniref:DUF883 domain-containing protein n=1 Tax=Thermanaerovibrio velox DSM 12556 TaxID=926567 RepID=H0UP25_9BACT|nr:DUF883 family protein [Thermanaerovibrio velox]EHM10528.1 hypothetical protein TheveDRAFT_1410 [Thermanaerovibrio velox DSM 12556]